MISSVVIGLTGPSGAGKTTVASLMSSMGCFVIDADKVARDIVKLDQCKQKLIDEFGGSIYFNGQLNRKELAKRAFSTLSKTRKLNQITHPYIVQQISTLVNESKSLNNDIIVIDAAVLFESGMDSICDKVIAILAPKEVRLKRIMNRDIISKSDALLRINAQNAHEYYTSRADYVVDGTHISSSIISELIAKILEAVNAGNN